MHADREEGYEIAYDETDRQYAKRVEKLIRNDAVAIHAWGANGIYTEAGEDAVAARADMVD
ncbi:MAG: hypothetical protein CR993_01765 [Rhodobacterales bacterium]|nr:MAG: hypothetical protein CR993_01765 [Rhodobacterales bacterium]